jgi:hypothetical protein
MIRKVYKEEPRELITSENMNMIPGIKMAEGREYRYVFDGINDDFVTKNDGGLLLQLNDTVLEDLTVSPTSESGRLYTENCKIILPTGEIFSGVSYKSDADGWRCYVEEGAKKKGILTAKLDTQKIFLSDNRSYDLFECSYCLFIYDLVTGPSRKEKKAKPR